MSASEEPSPPSAAGASAPSPNETKAGKKSPTARERFGAKVNPFAPQTTYCVTRSSDFQRIAALDRRDTWEDQSEALTLAFAKPALPAGTCPPKCPCDGTGKMRLRSRQAWFLTECYEQRGGIGMLGVGEGKTLVSLLLPPIMGWQRPVLFVPAALRDKTVKIDYPLLSRHWKLPPLEGPGNLEVRSYEEMGRQSFADYLALRRVPDGIIADECHSLARRGAGKTKRVLRFFGGYECEFVGMSGSIVHRSVMDYGHLTLLGLKDSAPLPHSFIELKTWADALDNTLPDYARPDPGALRDFCKEGETPRDGFRRRMLETPGIVSSADLSTSIGLRIHEIAHPNVPKNIEEAFHRLRNTAELPEGEVCTTALDQMRHARELFLGFYLKWLWPDGKRDKEWLDCRRRWRSYVRRMTTRSHGGRWYDTEAQVANGVIHGDLDGVWIDPQTGEAFQAYTDWVSVREDRRAKWGDVEPPKKDMWLSEYMLDAIEQWAKDNTGIVWVENICVLDKLRARGNTCFGAGENEIELEDGSRSVFASHAHTTGKNLQMFNMMLFSNPLQSGRAWEQALGREHRPGQKADDVIAHVFLGCRETWWAFERSRLDAQYIESTLGLPQRLNRATIVQETIEPVVLKRCDDGQPLWAETGHARIDGPLGQGGRGLGGSESHTPILDEMKEEARKIKKETKAREESAAS